MGFFKKKRDPISERSRLLEEKLASVQDEIKRLKADLLLNQESKSRQMHYRSTARPPINGPQPTPGGSRDSIFEKVEPISAQGLDHPLTTPPKPEELIPRKKTPWRRLVDFLRSPQPSNPRLLNLLAAGNIHGLRQLRHEKRVARNQFLVTVAIFILVLLGVLSFIFRKR